MAIPTSYTESEFIAYLVNEVLGPVATELSWTVDSATVANAVNETLLSLEAEDFTVFDTGATIKKLRAFGRREIWRQAAQVTAAEISVSADGASAQLQQVHAQCKAMFLLESSMITETYGGDPASLTAPSAVVEHRGCACDAYTPIDQLLEECAQ